MNLKNSFLQPLFNGAFLVLLLWLAGFMLYCHDVLRMPDSGVPADKRADGIVVLTGGSERITAGLDLLQHGFAPRLLISGVNPELTPQKLVGDHPAKSKISCCITLGIFAEDTLGNAKEAAEWADKHAVKTLIMVTSNYHIRRAKLEFAQTVPERTLYDVVVSPSTVKLEHWWAHSGTASLLIQEYNKLLFAILKAAVRMVFA